MTQDQQKSPMDLAATELLQIVTEKEAAGLSWDKFVQGLQAEVAKAEHRLAVALKVQDVCSATKPRKTRADKGKPRKTDAPQA